MEFFIILTLLCVSVTSAAMSAYFFEVWASLRAARKTRARLEAAAKAAAARGAKMYGSPDA